MSPASKRRAALEAALAADPEWEAFLRHFELSEGFSFLILLVDSRENAELCRDSLTNHLRTLDGLEVISFRFDLPGNLVELPSILRHPSLEEKLIGAIWIEAVVPEANASFEEWRSAWRTCFAHLNPMRNILQRTIPCPLVFVGAPWVRVAIRESAPDLWSIRGGVTRVAPRAETGMVTEARRPDGQADASSENVLDPEYAMKMAEELRGKPGQEAELARVLLRAGRGFVERRHPLMAVTALREAESVQREELKSEQHQREQLLKDLAAILTYLGRAYQMLADWPQAEACFREAFEHDRESVGEESSEVAIDLADLANLLRQLNRLSEAEALQRRALTIREKLMGQESHGVALSLNDLALLLRDRGESEEAEKLLRRSIAIDEKLYGPNSSDVASGLNNLGLVLQEQDNPEAEAVLRRALDIRENRYGQEDSRVSVTLVNLATVLQKANRLEEAETLFRRALDIDERLYGPDHPEVAVDASNLGVLLSSRSQNLEAERMYRRALVIDEKSFGPFHPRVALRLNNLAVVISNMGQNQEAEALLWRALQIRKQNQKESGYKHPQFDNAVTSYKSIVGELGWSEDQIAARLRSLDSPSATENTTPTP